MTKKILPKNPFLCSWILLLLCSGKNTERCHDDEDHMKIKSYGQNVLLNRQKPSLKNEREKNPKPEIHINNNSYSPNTRYDVGNLTT